jgi:hypothetical protein
MSTATELLRRALEELEIHGEVSTWVLIKEIRAFLAAESEAEPLPSFLTEQEPLGEEFSRILDKHRWDLYERGGGECQLKPVEPEAEPKTWQGLKMHEVASLWNEALDPAYFARAIEQALKEKNTKPEPAIRKPMTDEEIQKDSIFWLLYDQKSFVAGVRYAEKHHGIGGDDGEHK